MPIPLLAGAASIGGKLLGNIFGKKGQERRAARRAKRAAEGKPSKGLFGGFFKSIFTKKRNKGQKIIDSSNRIFEKAAAKDAKLRAKIGEKAKKSGVSDLKAWINSKANTSSPLPGSLKGRGSSGFLARVRDNLSGIRRAQQFQIPPIMREEAAKEVQIETPAATVSTVELKEAGLRPQNVGFLSGLSKEMKIGLGVVGTVILLKVLKVF